MELVDKDIVETKDPSESSSSSIPTVDEAAAGSFPCALQGPAELFSCLGTFMSQLRACTAPSHLHPRTHFWYAAAHLTVMETSHWDQENKKIK